MIFWLLKIDVAVRSRRHQVVSEACPLPPTPIHCHSDVSAKIGGHRRGNRLIGGSSVPWLLLKAFFSGVLCCSSTVLSSYSAARRPFYVFTYCMVPFDILLAYLVCSV